MGFKSSFFLVCFFSGAFVEALTPIPVDKYKLKNGMTVLLHEDHRLPIYSLYLWYDVGSSSEDPNRTGLAHFFEHLMFKGTHKNKEGVFDRLIETNGGSNNAFTSRDHTAYYVSMPAGTLETVLKLEADRMVNLEFAENKIQREREVVKEERRLRVDNSPSGLAYETLLKTTFKKEHPYQWPVIGSMSHLQSASLKDFKSFYKKHYAPNNAVLMLAGSFKGSNAKKWIQKHFGELKPQPKSKAVFSVRAFNKGKKVKLKKPVQAPLLRASLPGAKEGSLRARVLALASTALAEGASSRLYQTFVEKEKLALSVSFWSNSLKHEGFLYMAMTLRPKVSFARAERRLKEELKKLVSKGLTQQELNFAKKKTKLGFIGQFKTLNQKARQLAYYESVFGDYGAFYKEYQAFQDITLEQINAELKKALHVQDLNFVEVSK